jgi:hypothetical protein
MKISDVYAIILTADIDKVDFSQVPEENNSNLRYSLDGTQFVIKWNSDAVPTFITDGSVVPVQTLTHQECLDLMATPEWSEPEE